ncbi:hypothetical protein L226DRAFT_159817 [Lentinus tigrinus ALCF2SS1-7]|uniref:Uncharacterized protein n=1 Tax=Lentinus tigrinus ALCF2SS1-6 TaxID=1328759 RepID=A0A5C2S1K0_9APHY|nr:hypothetical protein L227DRAFT_228419 [Lentinus tigrinus ALCF2SS1-6]RPD71988.1 hypothetical protein L226DRAFT_159817 [Lentinus tigrinus ALCF2SS1-7]
MVMHNTSIVVLGGETYRTPRRRFALRSVSAGATRRAEYVLRPAAYNESFEPSAISKCSASTVHRIRSSDALYYYPGTCTRVNTYEVRGASEEPYRCQHARLRHTPGAIGARYGFSCSSSQPVQFARRTRRMQHPDNSPIDHAVNIGRTT